MIRVIIDRVRSMLVGPKLMTFARLPYDDMQQLLLIAQDQYSSGKSKNRGQVSDDSVNISPEVIEQLSDLKAKVASLTERCEVLERASYKKLQKSAEELKLNSEASLRM